MEETEQLIAKLRAKTASHDSWSRSEVDTTTTEEMASLSARISEEYAARHFLGCSPRRRPANTSEVGVHFFDIFAALNLAVIDTVMGHVNVHM